MYRQKEISGSETESERNSDCEVLDGDFRERKNDFRPTRETWARYKSSILTLCVWIPLQASQAGYTDGIDTLLVRAQVNVAITDVAIQRLP